MILEQAEPFELLSLRHFYPPAGSSRDWRPPVGSDFYHYEILGKTEIRNAKTRENLVSAFEKVLQRTTVTRRCVSTLGMESMSLDTARRWIL